MEKSKRIEGLPVPGILRSLYRKLLRIAPMSNVRIVPVAELGEGTHWSKHSAGTEYVRLLAVWNS